MKILIITDNNINNINGVVTTFKQTTRVLEDWGHEVVWITPSNFKTIPCPTYPEVHLAINPWKIGRMIKNHKPDAIHISTEGPLGFFAVKWCENNNIKFTTSYHTKTPEYIKSRFPWFPLEIGHKYLRRLHKNSQRILVTTPSMKRDLEENGYNNNIVIWGRGVDITIFNDSQRKESSVMRLLYVGRVSKEKNIEEFLKLKTDAKKIVVGDGPERKYLEEKYPEVEFVGYKSGIELAYYYANAEAFVFPSKTDTFGIVLLEAMACGTPIIAYPVTGPIDCVLSGATGILNDDLQIALEKVDMIYRDIVKAVGQSKTWERCTKIFEENLIKI